jgi:N-acetyl-gamma-glutamyl-phosphate reductase common form
LSADFRVKDPAVYEEFYGEKPHAPELCAECVYGMPEIYREQIRNARLVACPGCYPTSMILPLFPLLKRGLLDPKSIVVSSVSGVSGAGRNVKADYLFVECNESVRAYSVPKHRHLSEVEQELSNAAGERVMINFTPHLMPINRGHSHHDLLRACIRNRTVARRECLRGIVRCGTIRATAQGQRTARHEECGLHELYRYRLAARSPDRSTGPPQRGG